MILAFTAGIATMAATAAGLHAWRSARLAAYPETWPPGISFARHLSLAKAFLKRDGWKLIEPQPAWNIFIRAQKDRVGLSLMIHTEETLSLPTLMKDCVLVSAPTGIIMGILSQQTLPPELQADAAGHGIFVVNPADLPRHRHPHPPRRGSQEAVEGSSCSWIAHVWFVLTSNDARVKVRSAFALLLSA